MKAPKRCSIALAIALACALPAKAETHPERLVRSIGDDPKGETPECQAAKADAAEWSEGGVAKALKGIGRVVIWPLGEGAARRRGEAKNEARERLMERIRQACFTAPQFVRQPAPRDQRWPGGKGYRGEPFLVEVGGQLVSAVVHPNANTIMVRAIEGGPGYVYWSPDRWAAPVAWAIEPYGCSVTEDHPTERDAREVGFVCPVGVDLRSQLAAPTPRTRKP